MLVLFLALIIGPLMAGKVIKKLPDIPLGLLQPTGLNNNDTQGSTATGTGTAAGGGAATDASGATTTAFPVRLRYL